MKTDNVILRVKDLVTEETFEQLKKELNSYEDWENVLHEIYIEMERERGEFIDKSL